MWDLVFQVQISRIVLGSQPKLGHERKCKSQEYFKTQAHYHKLNKCKGSDS
jgi:hypothetical protein